MTTSKNTSTNDLQAFLTGTGAGQFLIRLILGVVFTYHGVQKLFGWFGGYGFENTANYFASIGIPFPTLSTLAAGGAELFGGLLLIAGLAVRTSSVLLTLTMLVASFTAHSGFNAAQGGMEYPLTLALVAAGLVFLGPGPLTVTALFRGPQAESIDGAEVTAA